MFTNSKSKNQNLKEIKNLKAKPFCLEERTALFGENVINFVKKVNQDSINSPLLNQIIRSATGVGANFMEATAALSKRDFRNRICICCKESKETKHWLRMIARANSIYLPDCRALWMEAHELTCIFSAILKKKRA